MIDPRRSTCKVALAISNETCEVVLDVPIHVDGELFS